MATAAPIIRLNSSTNTLLKAWGSAINSALTSIGLVQTADTGQINWSTTTAVATSANQTFGYEIWRFNDALQATKPIFMRLEFGTTVNGSIYPDFRVSVGTSTNGAGALTGLTSTIRPGIPGSNAPGVPNDMAYGQPCHFFSDGSSVCIELNPTTNANPNQGNACVWMVERTRNSDNTANGDGIVFAISITDRPNGQYYSRHNFISFLTNSVVGSNIYVPIAFTSNDYLGGVEGNSVYFYPFVVGMPKPEAQSPTLLGYQGGLSYYQTVQLLVNGGLHTYMAIPAVCGSMPGTSTESNGGNKNWCALLMRYE